MLLLGLTLDDGLTECEGDTEGELLDEGETDALGDTLADGETLCEGETEALGDWLADGETELIMLPIPTETEVVPVGAVLSVKVAGFSDAGAVSALSAVAAAASPDVEYC